MFILFHRIPTDKHKLKPEIYKLWNLLKCHYGWSTIFAYFAYCCK